MVCLIKISWYAEILLLVFIWSYFLIANQMDDIFIISFRSSKVFVFFKLLLRLRFGCSLQKGPKTEIKINPIASFYEKMNDYPRCWQLAKIRWIPCCDSSLRNKNIGIMSKRAQIEKGIREFASKHIQKGACGWFRIGRKMNRTFSLSALNSGILHPCFCQNTYPGQILFEFTLGKISLIFQ